MTAVNEFNYAIRPNKNVERKLVFEILSELDEQFPFEPYLYVGMGSFWFADFILAHTVLGIRRLTSIQKGERLAARARFNVPYACISVVEGDTATVIPEIRFDSGRAIIWLDHEVTPMAILDEVADLCSRLPSGSVLVITANARPDPGVQSEGEDLHAARARQFQVDYGELAPATLPLSYFEAQQFPVNLSSLLFKFLAHSVRITGRTERFHPLFNFRYRDNAPMITIGGMILNDVDAARLAKVPFVRTGAFALGEEQVEIAVPPLTTREKLTLDSRLPTAAASDLRDLGFELKPRQLEGYHLHYKRYPLFGEVMT